MLSGQLTSSTRTSYSLGYQIYTMNFCLLMVQAFRRQWWPRTKLGRPGEMISIIISSSSSQLPPSINLAIDIAGAFDRVSHAGFIHKVASMGIAGQLCTWLLDYLSGRRLQVVVGGQHSGTFPIRAGVPQGSILGPTLFLLYINDAKCCISPDTRLAVYADDTTLYSMIQAITDINMSTESLQQSVQAREE